MVVYFNQAAARVVQPHLKCGYKTDSQAIQLPRKRRFAPKEFRMSYRGFRDYSGSFITGIIAIGIGVIFLLKSLGYLAEINVRDYWPLILIVLGGLKTLFPRSHHSFFWGPIVAIIGVFFLMRNLHIFTFDITKLWPVLPILFGIRLLSRPFFKPCNNYHFKHSDFHKHGHQWSGNSVINDDSLSISLLMSGGKYVCTGTKFNGGNISITLAGCEIDLTKVIVPNEQIFLDINLMLGGIEMRIPETWSVSYLGTPVLGSFENKTKPVSIPEKKLVIRGPITLAGFEVRN
jgi:predicted membrane protein